MKYAIYVTVNIILTFSNSYRKYKWSNIFCILTRLYKYKINKITITNENKHPFMNDEYAVLYIIQSASKHLLILIFLNTVDGNENMNHKQTAVLTAYFLLPYVALFLNQKSLDINDGSK
eukprot:261579_1